jgi:hypothetical protein
MPTPVRPMIAGPNAVIDTPIHDRRPSVSAAEGNADAAEQAKAMARRLIADHQQRGCGDRRSRLRHSRRTPQHGALDRVDGSPAC